MKIKFSRDQKLDAVNLCEDVLYDCVYELTEEPLNNCDRICSAFTLLYLFGEKKSARTYKNDYLGQLKECMDGEEDNKEEYRDTMDYVRRVWRELTAKKKTGKAA